TPSPRRCPRAMTSTLFPYTTLFRSADTRWQTQCQGDCGQQEETELVAGQVLGAHGRQVFRSGARRERQPDGPRPYTAPYLQRDRSEEHTSELQSRFDLVCRLLLENK